MAEKPDTFAARLKALREAATLSVAELAERAGLARTHVHHLEAGTRQPDFATVQKLVVGLGKKSLNVFDGCQ